MGPGASTTPVVYLQGDADSSNVTGGAVNFAPFVTFAAQDATPRVASGNSFKTANTSATAITALDGGTNGQEVMVLIADAFTTVDFTATTLKGNAGVDWTPGNGDFMRCVFDGTNGYCDVHDATP